jgi:transcriptional regulator with PAS, ATPase and Fis domain
MKSVPEEALAMGPRPAQTAPTNSIEKLLGAEAPRAEAIVRASILGANSGLCDVMKLARRVAPLRNTVLLRGETGTGKELIARAIHLLSGRAKQPFVVANCAAIPQELMESEMFGHVRGAFTGAISNHAGYFEATRRGTLLLDEIGDLHLGLQGKILRILEDGRFRRVGGSETLHSHARIVAATHQPLERLIDDGRFRQDLYYRIHAFVIEIPPLRERREDIPLFAREFLSRFRAEIGESNLAVSDTAVRRLQSHPWHGNVRELRHCMERLAITCHGTVQEDDVRRFFMGHHGGCGNGEFRTLRLIERESIVAALRHFDGNRTHAARALGIGRRTLQNKIKQYGI